MARPQVADGGDGLQIWRVFANALNKQSRTDDKSGPVAWGLVEEVQLLTVKKKTACYEML
jgi:hypothetical protein